MHRFNIGTEKSLTRWRPLEFYFRLSLIAVCTVACSQVIYCPSALSQDWYSSRPADPNALYPPGSAPIAEANRPIQPEVIIPGNASDDSHIMHSQVFSPPTLAVSPYYAQPIQPSVGDDYEPYPPSIIPVPSAVPKKASRSSDERSPFRVQAYWMPSQNVTNQEADWSVAGQKANLAFPIYMTADSSNMWLATGSVDHINISTQAILSDSRLPVPDNLWNIQSGVINLREYDNGWKSTSIMTVGSASDRPFENFRDTTLTLLGSLEIPFRQRDAWNFSLFYSPTSQLPFPLPGLAYIWRPSDQLHMNIGLPFSLKYQPTEDFTFTASYFPLTNVNILARQRLGQNWSFYGGYQVVNDTYFLADRLERRELFFLFDQRLTIGVQRKIGLGFSLDFTGGYLFDRKVFQGEGFSDGRRDEIDIDPGAVMGLQLSWSR